MIKNISKKTTVIEYKRINQLGIKIHNNPIVPHVFSEEVDVALKKHNMNIETFNHYFGVQTCPLIDDKPGLYPWDVEAVLERMISKKLTGTQLFWD